MHVGQLHRIDGRCFAGPRLTTAASASLSRGLQQYFENPAADLAQRSQCSSSTRWYKGRNQVPRRGARPVLERMSADACRHPHTRAVNRVGARLLRYLWRGWPHLESGGFRFSRVVSRHILWLEGWTTDSHEKEGTICLVHAMLGEVEDGRRSTSRSILA
jgi:hypothetical protein